MLPLDATTLSAEDGDVNPVAALLRLQRCRRQAELPGLAATLFGALRREGRLALAERLSDALMRMLAVRFGGDETGVGHTEELRCALRHMEEPRMLAETVTQWRQEALDEGMRQGLSEGMRRGVSEGMRRGVSEGRKQGRSEGERALLRRLATGRFGIATGNALATLLANEDDVERLGEGRLGGRLRKRGGTAAARQKSAQRRELAHSLPLNRGDSMACRTTPNHSRARLAGASRIRAHRSI